MGKFLIIKSKKGFSLIELLVGIAIIITATTVVLSIIVSTFRISSKSTSNSVVRQNGNYAVSQISRTLQFAEVFEGAGNLKADGLVHYDSVCPDSGINEYHYLKVAYGGIDKEISCTDSGVKINNASSIDSNKLTVVPGTCKFTCTQENSALGPIIGINFDLVLGGTGAVPEKSARVNFSTTVKMRNP